MLIVTVEAAGRAAQTVRIETLPCRIGRGRDCELALAGWRLARVHAEVHAVGRALRIIDHGTLTGTLVNGERIAEFGPLGPQDEVEIAGYRLHFMTERPELSAQASAVNPRSARIGWRRLIHRQLLQAIDLRRRDLRQSDPVQLRAEIRALVEQLVGEQNRLPADLDPARLVDEVLDEALGLGPLEPLLEDPTITEIMVNGAHDIWIERDGRLSRSDCEFSDDDAVRGAIERIVAPLGRRVDESSPMVDARLADGSRVNAILPPLALRGPTLTIRRFNRQLLCVDDLRRRASASEAILSFLEVCVRERRNILVSGGTGSGKTTLLNVLSNLIPPGERIITIEDAAELSLAHAHVVQLEARPANLEGRGEIAIRDLVRNALRMRPDRIIVGECRAGEALDMLQAMNTGHDGSLTTIHANSPRDALSRLEVMALMAGVELPVQAIREQIASAIDVVVQVARLASGHRCVTAVSEVTGCDGLRIQMQDLFRLVQHPEGRIEHRATGIVPSFYEHLRQRGLALDLGAFDGSQPWQ